MIDLHEIVVRYRLGVLVRERLFESRVILAFFTIDTGVAFPVFEQLESFG